MSKMVLPRVQSMVLCDDVGYSALENDVFHLIGVRTTIAAQSFPLMRSLCVFLQMSGHQGEAFCHVKIENADSGEVIGETEPQVISFVDPINVVPVLVRAPDCVFSESGLYYVGLYDGGKLIGERRLTLYVLE